MSELRKIDSTIDTRKGQRGSYAGKVAAQIMRGAKKNGYEWGLSPVEVYKLFTASCVYCGVESGWPKTRNGIDRVDSKVGYLPGNCVTSCRMCNTAKGDKTVEEFMVWGRRFCEKNGFAKHG